MRDQNPSERWLVNIAAEYIKAAQLKPRMCPEFPHHFETPNLAPWSPFNQPDTCSKPFAVEVVLRLTSLHNSSELRSEESRGVYNKFGPTPQATDHNIAEKLYCPTQATDECHHNELLGPFILVWSMHTSADHDYDMTAVRCSDYI